MNCISLFTGMGMIDVAAIEMGWSILAQVENDAYCQDLLKQHFPNIPKYSHVEDFSGKKYAGRTDLVFGGFPCQPASHSGKRRGETDNRWLWPQMLRIAVESRTRWVVAENVYGLLTLDGGRVLQRICTDLENNGFQKPVIFDCTADTLGLQTLERHIWIITEATGERLENDRLWAASQFKNVPEKFSRGHQRELRSWHLPESRVLGVGERNPATLERLKAIGNAVPPNMAFQVFRTIQNFYSR